MKRFFAAMAIAVCAGVIFPASTVSWEGRAAVGSMGVFPGRGMYGLSRVFSVGEIVEVYNPVNETKITVVISNNTDLSGILILLSPEAADALGIRTGSDSVVRVSKIPEYTLEPVYGTDVIAAPIPDPDRESVAAIAGAAEPVKEVPLTITEEVPPTITEEVLTVTDEVFTEPAPIAHEPLAEPEFVEPPPLVATEIVPQPTPPVVEELSAETVTYSLLPTEENPPAHKPAEPVHPVVPVTEKPPVAAIAEPAKPAQKVLPTGVGKTLQSGAYYVQLAYLRDSENMFNLINRYNTTYPMAINEVDSGFQVLVGPLSQSECNAVLSQFKNLGFKDAFVKKIK